MTDRQTPHAKPTSLVAAFCWWLTVLTPLAWVVGACLYFPALVDSETLSPDADSSAIPIGGAFAFSIVLFFGMRAITKQCVRNIEPPGSLFAWRRDETWRSWLVSVGLGGAALLILIGEFFEYLRPWPWYEYVLVPGVVLFSLWLLGLRGAILSRKELGSTRHDQH